MQLQENFLFDDRYLLQKNIGKGGFSEVWLAKDQWTHLNVAIKIYAPGQGMDSDGMKEFCGELSSVYDLHHSKLLKPQHVDSWANMPYLIMSYCSNGSCSKYVGKATEEQLWKIIADVSSGLDYLHTRNVVHQDIKPGNILIDDAMDYLITDFGVSNRARSTLRKSVVSSSGGGTTAYMGPERFSKQPAPVNASDIWSLGATCFELLEGYVPFGDNGGLNQRLNAEIPTINSKVSDALKFTITKMLQAETWDRPTAGILCQWAANPQNIQIDYSLLSEDGNTKNNGGNTSLNSGSDEPKTRRFPDSGMGNAVSNNITSDEYLPSQNKSGKAVKIIVPILVVLILALAGFFIYRYYDNNSSSYDSSDYEDDPWESDVEEAVEEVPAEDPEVEEVPAEDPEEVIEEVVEFEPLSVSLQGISASADGLTKNITVYGDEEWKVEYPSGDMYSVSRSGNTLTVRIFSNPNTSPRSDYFVVKSVYGQQSIRIDLSQAAAASLSVSSTTVSASASGKTEYITVYGNKSWNIEFPTGTMYSVTRNGNTLAVRINPNSGSNSRSDYFNVKAADGSKTIRINMTQSAAEQLSVSSTSVSASASGTTTYITVYGDKSWYVEYPTGTMYSVTRNGNTLTVRINPNSGSSSRSDYFNVKATDGSKTIKITLSQYGYSSSY